MNIVSEPPTVKATLHLLCGKIASGKSTLAERLAVTPGTLMIGEDRWLAALYGDRMCSVADYVECSSKLRSAMQPHLVSLLRAGVSVILDFPANTRVNREWMMGIIQESGADHCLHYLNLPEEVCKARLRARNAGGEHDFSATEEQFDLITRYFHPPAADEGFRVTEYNH